MHFQVLIDVYFYFLKTIIWIKEVDLRIQEYRAFYDKFDLGGTFQSSFFDFIS